MAALSVADILRGKATGGKLSPAAAIIAQHLAHGTVSGTSGGGKTASSTNPLLAAKSGGFNWKDLGTGALNTLSVPGAALTTSLTNAIQAAKGEDLVSWKNLGGTFRGDKFQGGKGLVEALGVKKDSGWARGLGLVADIALDPTWLVGGGALVTASKFSRGANEATRLAKIGHLKTSAQAAEKFTELAPQLGKGDAAVVSRMQALADSGAFAQQQARSTGFTPAIRLGAGRKTVDGVRVPRGLQIPLWNKPIRGHDITKIAPENRFSLSPSARWLTKAQDRSRALSTLSIAKLDREVAAILDPASDAGKATLARVGTVMTAAGADRKGGKALINSLRASGTWDATHDALVRVFTKYARAQDRQLGYVTHRQQAAIMQRFLSGKYDEVNPLLGQLASEAHVVDKQLAEAVVSVRETQAMMLARLQQQSIKAAAPVVAEVQNLERAASVADARAQRLSNELETVTAQLGTKYNDPKYARRLAASNQGRKLMGWSPKDQAAKLTQVRRTALRTRQRAIEKELRRTEELKAEALKAVKAPKKKLQKIHQETNATALKLSDRFSKTESETIARFGKRKEALLSKLDDFATTIDKQIESEARVFAKNINLIEFTKGRRYTTKKSGGLRVASGKPENLKNLTLREIHEKALALMNRGTYIHHAPDPDMMEEVRDFMNLRRSHGDDISNVEGSALPGATKAMRKRTALSPFEVVTRETAVQQMVKAGIPGAEAEGISEVLNGMFKFSKSPVQYSKQNIPGITYLPDVNALSLVKSRERLQYDTLLKKNFESLAAEILDDPKAIQGMWGDLTKVYNTKRIPGSPAAALGYAKVAREGGKVPGDVPRLVLATGWLKTWYTVMNIGHFFMNVMGSFVNDLVVGGPRHALTGLKGSVPKADPWKLGQMDLDSPVMQKMFKVGKVELSGEQLGTYARLSGLGIGYTEAEIEMVAHIFETKGKVTAVARIMNKLNMDRENADRVWSWMNHIKSGDDPFTAAARVIQAKFDYNAATHFERIWMRNLMLFYTWFKNNLVLQGNGILARPGIYSTMQHIENSRPKDPAEPTWWKKAGGLYTPFGLLTFGNPMADIYKFDVSQENFRKNVLGALTPFVSSPLQMATNKDFFTGGDLSKFADQNIPHPAGYLLNPLGVGQASRGRSEGEKSPAIPWYLAKLIKDFTGPYGSTAGTLLSNPDSEVSPMYSVLPRLTGARINPKEPEKWQRSLKAREAKKKADATRKANYEGK